jgi:SulP family sulfate permease
VLSPSIRRYALAFARPVEIVRRYRPRQLRADMVAGLTVAVLAIPQSIAYASIAGLPPTYGLYSAAVAVMVGALWGSSRFLSTGPTNAISILVLSILTPLAAVGTAEFMMAASLMAVMVGALCIVFGFAGLGMLVNFASRAVLLGFTTGAGILIAVGQLKNLLRLDIPRSPHLWRTMSNVISNLDQIHVASLALGVATVLLILLLDGYFRRLPGSLVALVSSGLLVAVVGAERLGLDVVGAVPRSVPRMTTFNLGWVSENDLFGPLAMGSLAVAALGLVEAISIAREIARQSGERLDVNQELVGQGVANIAAGLFSGYASSGSFTRSAVNFQSGARTQVSSVLCGLLILAGIFAFGPLASYLPRAALAGMIVLIAYRMVDWRGVRRVIRTSRTDSTIMLTTFAATLLLSLEFAVLAGVMLSLGIYVYRSSMPTVEAVVPDESFQHLVVNDQAPVCPQLGIIQIHGDLFFGAATHVEDALLQNFEVHPGQNFLLLQMGGVNQCDLSGVDVLEEVLRLYRGAGGDLFLEDVQPQIREKMRRSGFEQVLGRGHFLESETAVEWIFDNILDPAVCCYECEHRVFAECHALEKHPYDIRLPSSTGTILYPLKHLDLDDFVDALERDRQRALLIDVREPSEFEAGRPPGAVLMPLRTILESTEELPRDRPIYLVSRSGRRSTRAMRLLLGLGFEEVFNLKGGMLNWRARNQPMEFG